MIVKSYLNLKQYDYIKTQLCVFSLNWTFLIRKSNLLFISDEIKITS